MCLPTASQARETAFSRDVSRSIDDGINWLINQNAFAANGQAVGGAGLVALALWNVREARTKMR